jgi:hypothetical protein
MRQRSRSIALFAALVLGLGALLAACGQSYNDGLHGSIAGDVTAGPMCPVERADKPCPDAPVANREVDVFTQSSATAEASATAAASATAQATLTVQPVGTAQSGTAVPGQTTSAAQAAQFIPASPVATTTTDTHGHFTVNVPPGAYVVTVATGPGLVGVRQTWPAPVTVLAGETLYIQIKMDTGIR